MRRFSWPNLIAPFDDWYDICSINVSKFQYISVTNSNSFAQCQWFCNQGLGSLNQQNAKLGQFFFDKEKLIIWLQTTFLETKTIFVTKLSFRKVQNMWAFCLIKFQKTSLYWVFKSTNFSNKRKIMSTPWLNIINILKMNNWRILKI